MKKILLCFVCIGYLVSFYLPTQVQADKVQSKVTGTLVAPTPSSSDKDKASSHKYGGLPKTGEESSVAFGVLGLSLIVIGGGTWYFKKRREDDHV